MDPQLHRQLDHLEKLEVAQQRERLSTTFEALHGHPAPAAWLDAALHSADAPTASSVPSSTSKTSDEAATMGQGKPSWWPKRWVSPATLWFRSRVMGAAAMTGAGLSYGIAGLLGKSGLAPDHLINLNADFQHTGAMWLLSAAVLLPWKGLRQHFKATDQWSWRRQGRPIQKWAGWSVFMTLPLMSAGAIQATLSAERQIVQVSYASFDAFQNQREMNNQIFQIDKEGNSGLPQHLAHDGPTCQLFRAHLDEMDGQPTTDLGQLFNGVQAAIGYGHGCLTDQELFSRENAYWARAQAWSFPAILPHSSYLHQLVADTAGLTPAKWCITTNEWPEGVSFADRSSICAALPTTHLDHPVSLASMGVKVPPATSAPKTP